MVDKELETKVDETGRSKRVTPPKKEETDSVFYMAIAGLGAAASVHPSTRELGIPALAIGIIPFAYHLAKDSSKAALHAYKTLKDYLHSP
jgi:hypothetical protein